MSHRHSQPHTLTIWRCHLPSSSKFTEAWLRADWLIFYVALKHWLLTPVLHTAQKWATFIWQLKDGSNAPTHIKGDVRKCDWCYASRSFQFTSKPQWSVGNLPVASPPEKASISEWMSGYGTDACHHCLAIIFSDLHPTDLSISHRYCASNP